MSFRPPLPPDVRRSIAAHPGRLVSSRTLHALGHNSTRVAQWVQADVLERILRGRYRDPDDVVPRLQPVLAIWDYLVTNRPHDGLRLSGLGGLAVAGVAVERSWTPTFVVQHGRRVRLSDAEIRVVQRRTLGGERMDPRRLVLEDAPLCLVDALREGDWTPEQLRVLVYRVMNRLRCRPSELRDAWLQLRPQQAAPLLSLLADGSLQHESPAERRTFLDILCRHPPAPDCQVWVTDQIRVDYAYVFAGLVLEYHGEETHRDRVDADAIRSYLVNTLGHEVLIITKGMTHDEVGLATYIHGRRRDRERLILEGRIARPALPEQRNRLVPLRTAGPSPL